MNYKYILEMPCCFIKSRAQISNSTKDYSITIYIEHNVIRSTIHLDKMFFNPVEIIDNNTMVLTSVFNQLAKLQSIMQKTDIKNISGV